VNYIQGKKSIYKIYIILVCKHRSIIRCILGKNFAVTDYETTRPDSFSNMSYHKIFTDINFKTITWSWHTIYGILLQLPRRVVFVGNK
jgi:hypothetical protein